MHVLHSPTHHNTEVIAALLKRWVLPGKKTHRHSRLSTVTKLDILAQQSQVSIPSHVIHPENCFSQSPINSKKEFYCVIKMFQVFYGFQYILCRRGFLAYTIQAFAIHYVIFILACQCKSTARKLKRSGQPKTLFSRSLFKPLSCYNGVIPKDQQHFETR